MRIDTNTIGNYTPTFSRPVQNKANVQSNTAVSLAKVTNEEKKYFANLYPANKAEIMDYHYYQKDGKMAGVSVGSLFDRRG
jgi:hypothetical protein